LAAFIASDCGRNDDGDHRCQVARMHRITGWAKPSQMIQLRSSSSSSSSTVGLKVTKIQGLQ